MKKICLFLALTMVLTGAFTGCTVNKNPAPLDPVEPGPIDPIPSEPTNPEVPPVDGGQLAGDYAVNTVYGQIPDDALQAFNAAITEDQGIKPVALLGQQVVAGLNYAFLVECAGEYSTMVIYKPISGETPSVLKTKEFNYQDYLTKEIKVLEDSEMLEGGYVISTEGGLTSMPERLATATCGAFMDFTDCTLEALCQLGTQVVAGTNYALLCRGYNEGSEIANLYFVELYDGVDGTQSLLTVNPITLTDIL